MSQETHLPSLIGLPPPRHSHPPMRVFVHLVHGFGGSRWAEAWAKGQMTGILEPLPYGYHQAADENCIVLFSQDGAEGGVVAFLRLGLRRLLGFDLIHTWRNRKRLLSDEIDVVWTHTELEHLAVLLLWRCMARKRRRPKLIAQSVWLYDRWHQLSRAKRWLFAKLLAQADVLSVLSPENFKVAQQLFPRQRVEFIRFGIDSMAMIPAVRREASHPLRILALGRDMHRDWATLIAAVGNWERCEVKIGGKKIPRGLVADVANVALVEPATARDIPDLFAWADLMILPLKRNLHASGITVLAEAVSSGVPVICTDTGGLRAYFSDDEVYYVPPTDPRALRLAVEELGGNTQMRFSLAKKAQQRMIAEELNSRAYARRHREISFELVYGKTDPAVSGYESIRDSDNQQSVSAAHAYQAVATAKRHAQLS